MKTRSKHFHAWIIFLAAMTIGTGLYLAQSSEPRAEVVIAWVAGSWAITQFLHQHELERNRFFLELFKDFNARYDKLNNLLQAAAEKAGDLSADEKSKIVDYFNLCAEEYLFYTKGYVPPDVWRAWRQGMNWYARNPQFVKLWNEEKTSDSYYDFDFLKRT